jgi:hypothetical protein
VSTARCSCRSSLSRPDVVCYGGEVAERVKKTISVPETKKKEELPMKLLDDLKIPMMSTHAFVLVDSVGPLSAEVCRTVASFP